MGTWVEIAADDEDEWDPPNIYGRTAGDLDTRCHKSYGRYLHGLDMPDMSDPSLAGHKDVGPYPKLMQHLIDSDDEIYVEAP